MKYVTDMQGQIINTQKTIINQKNFIFNVLECKQFIATNNLSETTYRQLWMGRKPIQVL